MNGWEVIYAVLSFLSMAAVFVTLCWGINQDLWTKAPLNWGAWTRLYVRRVLLPFLVLESPVLLTATLLQTYPAKLIPLGISLALAAVSVRVFIHRRKQYIEGTR